MEGNMNRKINTIITSIILLAVITPQNGGAANMISDALAGEAIITFEEPIPAPDNVKLLQMPSVKMDS